MSAVVMPCETCGTEHYELHVAIKSEPGYPKHLCCDCFKRCPGLACRIRQAREERGGPP